MSGFSSNSIFWVDTSKIAPNPFQPRRDFDEHALEDLADSIRQYGVLQPLVVTRKETYRPDGGMEVSYELIAGERRLRAATIAQLNQVPVIIRTETDDKVKLELAIIENLQREDLNPIDRALAFEQLHRHFNLTHAEIGKRMGKSRVYVSNSLRLLALPDDIKKSLGEGRITEGHTRPLLMLVDRPDEQLTLFKEILLKNLSVRDAEKIARRVAQDRIRKKEFAIDPRIRAYELKISENLGTRVQIEQGEHGGKIVIDYFTQQDLEKLLSSLAKRERDRAEAQTTKHHHSDDHFAEDNLRKSTAIRFEPTFKNKQATLVSDFKPVVTDDLPTKLQGEVERGSDEDQERSGESTNIVDEESVHDQTLTLEQDSNAGPSAYMAGNPYLVQDEVIDNVHSEEHLINKEEPFTVGRQDEAPYQNDTRYQDEARYQNEAGYRGEARYQNETGYQDMTRYHYQDRYEQQYPERQEYPPAPYYRAPIQKKKGFFGRLFG